MFFQQTSWLFNQSSIESLRKTFLFNNTWKQFLNSPLIVAYQLILIFTNPINSKTKKFLMQYLGLTYMVKTIYYYNHKNIAIWCPNAGCKYRCLLWKVILTKEPRMSLITNSRSIEENRISLTIWALPNNILIEWLVTNTKKQYSCYIKTGNKVFLISCARAKCLVLTDLAK